MINKFHNESIIFDVVITDSDGTALVGEAPIIYGKDFTGSQVLVGTGTHSASGSYSHQVNITTGWGTGPFAYHWEIKGTEGTSIEAVTNELNILAGTLEPTGYIYESELSAYYGKMPDYLDEHSQDKITQSYNYINRILESLGIDSPRNKNSDGLYDAALRSWNAWLAIYNIVQDREVSNTDPGEEAWYDAFWKEGTKIEESIRKKKIVFRDQVSAAESGISKPVRSAGSSIGTMYNNWDRSYGKRFQGDEFNRKWSVEVTGTGTASDLFECTAQWSRDSEQSFGSITTGFEWIELQDEVFVRFEKGTNSGTNNVFAIGDKWTFETHPIRTQVGGQRTAKSY